MKLLTAERMAHPIAQRIPEHIWSDFFCEDISENLLQLMASESEAQLDAIVDQFPFFHDADEDDVLLDAHVSLINEERMLVFLAIAMNPALRNMIFLDRLLKRYQVHPKAWIATVLLLGDHVFFLALMTHYKSMHNEIYQEIMLDENIFIGAFAYASKHGLLPILNCLEKIVPDLFIEMMKADDFWAFRLAAKEGQAIVLNYFEQKLPDELVLMMEKHLHDTTINFTPQLQMPSTSAELNNHILAIKKRLFERFQCLSGITTKTTDFSSEPEANQNVRVISDQGEKRVKKAVRFFDHKMHASHTQLECMPEDCVPRTMRKQSNERKETLLYSNAYGPEHFQPKWLRKERSLQQSMITTKAP